MNLLRRLWYLVTARQQADDLADEMDFHRQMTADALRRDGVSEADLRSSAQRALGNDLLSRERARDVWVALWLQDITQDFRFGARMLIKDRRFTIASIVALGLGIGVNSSVFTIMNAALFRPLPFARVGAHRRSDPDRRARPTRPGVVRRLPRVVEVGDVLREPRRVSGRQFQPE